MQCSSLISYDPANSADIWVGAGLGLVQRSPAGPACTYPGSSDLRYILDQTSVEWPFVEDSEVGCLERDVRRECASASISQEDLKFIKSGIPDLDTNNILII
jgi:hypothetical protein